MADIFERGAGDSFVELQKPTSAPESVNMESGTSLLLAPIRAADHLRNFPPEVYDTRAESHLSRFLKVLLGDAGVGALKKHLSVARQQQSIWGTHFLDLDRFYGALFGVRRYASEALGVDPYAGTATAEEWEDAIGRDGSFRSRIEQFARALPIAQTPHGIEQVSEALLSVDCDVYETYVFVDENLGSNPGGSATPAGARTYGDVETDYVYYGEMVGTYADIEGGQGTFGRTTTQNRQEFIVRPKRQITLEETYELTRVLNVLKPADALLTIDSQGVALHQPLALRGVHADSEHWEITTRVLPAANVAAQYQRPGTGAPVVQPRPVFSGYQGEAWTYNGDIVEVRSYTETEPGVTGMERNYQRVAHPGYVVDHLPTDGIADHARAIEGRMASDAILVRSPYDAQRFAPALVKGEGEQ